MKILFMGTPEISAICLSKIVESGMEVVGVLTGEDKPTGRGYKLTPSPVKVLALEKGLKVYQPHTLRDAAFADLLKEINPDAIVVVAYGKILPKNVLDYPRYGCINLHVSLLPKYRGAAPMQRAIMGGETETGVTVMYMDEGVDTGDIISVEKFPILPRDNFENVHDNSAVIGSKLLVKTLFDIEKGIALRTKQPCGESYAKKIEKEDRIIDFSKSAKEIDCQIRGLSPMPLAYTMSPDGKMLKIVSCHIESGKGRIGEVILADSKNNGRGIVVATGEGAIAFDTVIPEGKGKMSAADLIRGRKINQGDILKA